METIYILIEGKRIPVKTCSSCEKAELWAEYIESKLHYSIA